MSRIKAPPDLPGLVRSAFAKARSDGELHYYPTQVTLLYANSIPFQLRFSPALANKPKAPPRDPASKPLKPFDPFENPPAALKITDLGPSHFLVLNKFAVVPEHFILATHAFEHQTHVLEAADLESTLACIEAYEEVAVAAQEEKREGEGEEEKGLFAFFNCGEHSGASQPHRHIQLLPIARMTSDLGEQTPWDVLVDRLGTQKPPFAVFTEDIKLGMSGRELHEAYLRLYRKACRAVAQYQTPNKPASDETDDGEVAPAEGEARISYNMAMTKTTLAVSPRLAEGADIIAAGGATLGSLALNGTVLAGTALVKSELEWDALRRDPQGFANVLRGIGVPTDKLGEI